MIFLVLAVGTLLVVLVSIAVVVRRRDAAARRAWEIHCNEQALANDAALAARRSAFRTQ